MEIRKTNLLLIQHTQVQIMKRYPKIFGQINATHDIYAFDKLDGSNIRVEWTRKKGFVKWGTRKQLLSSEQGILTTAIEKINNKYLEDLTNIFKKQRYEKAVCFMEFVGPNSFAGSHHDAPKDIDVILFDISPHKKGMLPANEFLKLCKNLHTPDVLYHGKANARLIEQVENGTLPGMTFEGVVCKGPYVRKTGMPIIFKIKNRAWIDKLKIYCGDDEKLFENLI